MKDLPLALFRQSLKESGPFLSEHWRSSDNKKETDMRIIFCADYWNPLSLDSAYEAEAALVEKGQLTSSLINFEALVEQQNIAFYQVLTRLIK
jgi:hypothetical protein